MLPLICTVHKIALPSLWGFLLLETQAKVLCFHIRKEQVAQSHYWAVESRPGIYIRPYTPPVFSKCWDLELSTAGKRKLFPDKKIFFFSCCILTELKDSLILPLPPQRKDCFFGTSSTSQKTGPSPELCLVFMGKPHGKVPDGVQESPNPAVWPLKYLLCKTSKSGKVDKV